MGVASRRGRYHRNKQWAASYDALEGFLTSQARSTESGQTTYSSEWANHLKWRAVLTRAGTHAQGVTAYPHSEEDMFHWTARIEGLGGTDWEGWFVSCKINRLLQPNSCCVGGVFQVKLAFSEYYNYSPPSASFMTIPFHPNSEFTQSRKQRRCFPVGDQTLKRMYT